jgi:hypothetical protein
LLELGLRLPGETGDALQGQAAGVEVTATLALRDTTPAPGAAPLLAEACAPLPGPPPAPSAVEAPGNGDPPGRTVASLAPDVLRATDLAAACPTPRPAPR